jgi:glycosyltransferase involved in cell wall biosynthesis
VTRVLFVNAGILGLASFHRFLKDWIPRQSVIDAEHLLLSHALGVSERIIRRVLCQRLWVDGLLGVTNVDLARLRHELHAGLQARRRINRVNPRRFDVLHFHRQATAYASLDLMRQIPSIVSIDCTQECVTETATSSIERASYRPNEWIDGLIYKRAAAIVSTSRWAADSLGRRHPDCRAPIHVMSSPVLLDYFDRRWIEARRRRAAAGARPRLLFMGGDFPRKGGYDLLQAWQAGGFSQRAELELVSNWDIDGPLPAGATQTRNVSAHSAEWAAVWARADAFVMPTRNEAFGLVYQEAAAAGLPAIGTRHNAVPEIIIDGETGLLVPLGDRQALVSAMATLVDSQSVRDRLGLRAREVIERVASPQRYLEQLTAVILDATARRLVRSYP